MPETLGSAVLELSTDSSKLDSGLKSAESKASSTADKFKGIGSTLSLGLTAPIVAAGAAIVSVAGGFEASINKLSGLSSDTGESFDRLRDKAKDLGSTTQFSASQAAQGMIALTQAGFSTEEVLSGIDGTLTLAAAGTLELGRASEITANTMAQFGLEADQAGRVGNVLAATAKSATTDIEQLSQGFKFAGTAADASGLSFEQTSAVLGIFANKAIQGSTGGERLRTILGALAKPTKTAADALDAAGVAVGAVNVEARGLPAVLETLKQANLSTAQSIEIFGIEAKDAANVLISEGAAGLNAFTEGVTGTDAATKQAAANMEGFEGAMKTLQSALEGLAIAIAESGLLDFVTEIVKSVASFVQELTKTNPEILKWGTVLAGVAAAIGPVLVVVGTLISSVTAISGALAGVGGLTGILGTLGTAFTVLTGPIGLTVAAIAAASAAVFAYRDEIWSFLQTLPMFSDELLTFVGLVDDSAEAVEEATVEYGKAETGAADYMDSLLGLGEAVEETEKETVKLTKATKDTKKEFDKFDLAKSIKAAETFAKELEKLRKDELEKLTEIALPQLTTELEFSAAAAFDATGDMLRLVGGLNKLDEPLNETGVFAGDLEAAFKNLGIKSQSVAQNELVELGTAIETVRRAMANGQATAADLQAAEDAYAKALAKTGGAIEKTEEFGLSLSGVLGVFDNLDQKIGDAILSGNPLDALRGMFDQLKSAAQAFVNDALKLVTSELTNLIGMKDGLGGLKDQLSGIFSLTGGGGGGAAASIPGAGGGIPGVGGGGGGAGGIGSGLGGVAGGVNLASGIASAVSGVIGLFQTRRTNKLLDLIEVSTRETALFLGGRGDQGILGVLFTHSDFLQDIFGQLLFVNPSLDDMKGHTGELAFEVNNAGLGFINPSLDTIKGSLFSIDAHTDGLIPAIENLGTKIKALANKKVSVNVNVPAGGASSTAPTRSRSGSIKRDIELNTDGIRTTIARIPTRSRSGS